VRAAREATAQFVAWLEQQAPSRPAIRRRQGELHWGLRNVLVPMSGRRKSTLKRELARPHAALKLEEGATAICRNCR
jgi:hypothetical protein